VEICLAVPKLLHVTDLLIMFHLTMPLGSQKIIPSNGAQRDVSTLDVPHVQHKGRMMNTLESFRIYEAHKQGIQLNEAVTEPYNPIFEIIINNRLNNNPLHDP
jgi:hypothetical protein